MERELGQELFTRTHNSAQLNDAGRLAVDHARVLLRDERMMLDAFADLARRQRTLLVAPSRRHPSGGSPHSRSSASRERSSTR